MNYSRLISLGSVPGTPYSYKARCSVDIEVELREKPEGLELSMMGSIWKPNRSDIVQGGQCCDEIARLFPDDVKVQQMIEVWRRWHLNGMRAGCEHQRAEEWDKRPIDPSKPLDTYGIVFEGQRHPSWNMLAWVGRGEHPEGLLSVPCPVCGYRYGSAWLFEPLPAEVVAQVRSW